MNSIFNDTPDRALSAYNGVDFTVECRASENSRHIERGKRVQKTT